MCCRFHMEEYDPELEKAAEDTQEILNRLEIPGKVRLGDFFPGQWTPVLSRGAVGPARYFPMLWGFSGRRPLYNARSETADRLPAFSASFLTRRCLIPMTWYVEWGQTEEGKTPFAIRPAQEGRFYLAGLYRFEPGEKLPRFTVLTREPAEEIAWIHPRMPVILPHRFRGDWLDPKTDAKALMAGARAEQYVCRPIGGRA